VSGGLRYAVLGPVRAWRGADQLDLGSPQQRALLALLLLRRGRLATADELIDALWEGDPPPRALGAVRTYASRLRRVLEPGEPGAVLESVARGYRLRVPPGGLDLAVFEDRMAAARRAEDPARAAELVHDALSLWQGEPLAGLPGPYAASQRDRLAEVYLAAVEYRLELDLTLGRHAELIAELAELVARHPLREGLRATEMLALYRAGRQAEALQVYADARELLVEELGADPGP